MSRFRVTTLTFASSVLGVMLACSMSHDNTQVDAASSIDAPAHVTDAAATDPVVIDRSRVRTADTDADQLETGSFLITATPAETTVKVADGPFVATDFMATGASSVWSLRLFVSSSTDCKTRATGAFSLSFSSNETAHGTKLFAKAGQFLCVSLYGGGGSVSGNVTWAGFHPYAAP
jgi:hypothetical protein